VYDRHWHSLAAARLEVPRRPPGVASATASILLLGYLTQGLRGSIGSRTLAQVYNYGAPQAGFTGGQLTRHDRVIQSVAPGT